MLDLTCRMCGMVYHADEQHIGRYIKCSRCGCLIQVTSDSSFEMQQREPAAPVESPSIAPPSTEPRSRHVRLNSRGWFHGWRMWATVGAFLLLFVGIGLYLGSGENADESPTEAGLRSDSASPPTPPPESSERSQQSAVSPSADPEESVPSCRDRKNALPTGSRIEPDYGTNGKGRLTVDNGTDEDAVVELVDSGTDENVRYAYVRAHDKLVLSGIEPGTYNLMFSMGTDWNETTGDFDCEPSYSEFEKQLNFSETREAEGVRYKTARVTLHPVPEGTARTNHISRAEFHKSRARHGGNPIA